MEDKYVYCVYEDSHGLVSIWDNEADAKAEVERIEKNYDDPEECVYWRDGTMYGSSTCNFERTKLNVPW